MVVTLQAISRLGYAYRRLKRVSRQNAALEFNVDLLLSEVLPGSAQCGGSDGSTLRAEAPPFIPAAVEGEHDDVLRSAQIEAVLDALLPLPGPCHAAGPCVARASEKKHKVGEAFDAQALGGIRERLSSPSASLDGPSALPKTLFGVVAAADVQVSGGIRERLASPDDVSLDGPTALPMTALFGEVAAVGEIVEEGASEEGPATASESGEPLTEETDIWPEFQHLRQEARVGDPVILELQQFLMYQRVTDEDTEQIAAVLDAENPEEALRKWMDSFVKSAAATVIQGFWREECCCSGLITHALRIFPLQGADAVEQAVCCLSFTKLRSVRKLGTSTTAWWWFCIYTIGLFAEGWATTRRPSYAVVARALQGLLASELRLWRSPVWIRRKGAFPKRFAFHMVQAVSGVRRVCYKDQSGDGHFQFQEEAADRLLRGAVHPAAYAPRELLEDPEVVREAARQTFSQVTVCEARAMGIQMRWEQQVELPGLHPLFQ